MSKIRHQASRRVAKNSFKLGHNGLRPDESMVSLCKTIPAKLISKTLVNGSLINSRLWLEMCSLIGHSSSRNRGDLTFGTQCRARMIMKMRRRRGEMRVLVPTCTTCSK